MGIGMAYLEYLSDRGHLKRTSRILDIGSQNLYNVTVESFLAFTQKYGSSSGDAALTEAAKAVAYFSTPRPGERTTYLSELLDHTDIFYTSYDVCPALKTEIFDLNRERLPDHYNSYFDIVLNFGTTEHIFNQLNSYEVMHDALAAGGVVFHQVPSIAWTGHGYFSYHVTFFDDLAKANGYEVLDRWYSAAGISNPGAEAVEIRDERKPLATNDTDVAPLPEMLTNYNLNIVLRKVHDAPFRVGLEIATSHSALSDEIEAIYGPERRVAASGVLRPANQPRRLTDEMLLSAIDKAVAQALGGAPGVISGAVQRVVPSLQSALADGLRNTVPEAMMTAIQAKVPAELRFRAINETPTADLARALISRVRRKIGL